MFLYTKLWTNYPLLRLLVCVKRTLGFVNKACSELLPGNNNPNPPQIQGILLKTHYGLTDTVPDGLWN